MMSKNENKRSAVIQKLLRVWHDLRLTVALMIDYWRGNYSDVSRKTIITIVAAFLYILLSPIGYIPILGQIDDLIVIMICLWLIRDDLQKYKAYKGE